MEPSFTDDQRLRAVIREVLISKETLEFASVNTLLESVKMHDSEFVMVGHLRASFSIRSELPSWLQLLYNVEAELLRRQINAPQRLRGLYP